MEPQAVLNLFDSSWFYPKIFENRWNLSTLEPNPVLVSGKQLVPSQLSIRGRSRSEQLDTSFLADSSSPKLVLSSPRLQTILSEKEISEETSKTTVPRLKKSRKGFKKTRKGFSKSLSDLEFEELKGFMDLGFVFSEEDKDSSLVEIIPGLQRLGHNRDDCEEKEENTSASTVEEFCGPRTRPYLSEAWQLLEKRQEENTLMSWRVPSVNNEVVMKDSLKLWAHNVASAVR